MTDQQLRTKTDEMYRSFRTMIVAFVTMIAMLVLDIEPLFWLNFVIFTAAFAATNHARIQINRAGGDR